jgi:hypothetical protein
MRPRRLGEQDEPDDQPDDHQDDQDPEQERRLADRQPRDLALAEEEARPAPSPSVIVVLDNLAARGGGRVVRRLAFRVRIADNGARDQWWLTLGASDDRSLVHVGRCQT